MNLIGKIAPNFIATAINEKNEVIKELNLYKNIEKKKSLLFFFPLSFTFVCPSELIAINNRINEFKKRNIEIFAISVDSHFVLQAWKKTKIENGGIGELKYTLISDLKKNITKIYNLEDENTGVSYRGSFIIDEEKLIRAIHTHDFQIGRNIDEYIRIFDAIEFNKKTGNLCPAGWTNGKDGISANNESLNKFLKENQTNL